MSRKRITLHILPKKNINLSMNEHGDIYIDNLHLGELNLFNDSMTGVTGPCGPSTIGLRGSRGPIGDMGVDGPIGYSTTGVTGYVGDDGPRGLIGTIGPRGRDGDIGDIGPMGAKGQVRHENPRHFLYARVNNEFKYGTDDFNIIPWYHISNNGFKIANDVISFPNETGVYKIEMGVQIIPQEAFCTHSQDDLESASIQLQLCFTKKRLCKSSFCVIPYCQTKAMNISNCETLHYVHTVTEPTDMYIKLNTHNCTQQFENMFISITEIL